MVLMFLFLVLASELTWKHLRYLGVAAMPGAWKVLLVLFANSRKDRSKIHM